MAFSNPYTIKAMYHETTSRYFAAYGITSRALYHEQQAWFWLLVAASKGEI